MSGGATKAERASAFLGAACPGSFTVVFSVTLTSLSCVLRRLTIGWNFSAGMLSNAFPQLLPFL